MLRRWFAEGVGALSDVDGQTRVGLSAGFRVVTIDGTHHTILGTDGVGAIVDEIREAG